MKKLFALLLCICLLAGVFAGCTASKPAAEAPAEAPAQTDAPETQAEAPAQDEPLKIAFSNTTSGIFQMMISDTIENWCKEKGYTYTMTLNNGDSTQTLADVQSYINTEQDYLLVYCLDEGTQESIRKLAENSKTRVIFMGLELEGYTTISGGNYDGSVNVGKKAYEKVQERWGGEYDLCVLIEATSYGTVNTERTSGFLDGYSESCGHDISDEVVRLDYSDVLKAQEAFATTLAAYPDAEKILVYGVTDANQTIGAWNAACAAGREDQLIITGVHVADEATPGLLTNHPEIWIGQSDPMGLGYGDAFIQFVEGFEAGQDLTGTTIPSAQTWVDASNVAEHYEVK